MTVLPNIDPSPCRKKIKKTLRKTCSVKTLKRRLPILSWLPKYKPGYFPQDFIAGITVGLTAIPQGIAYAVVAGLPPEHGLYASLTSGVIYVFFGSCYNVTVGPTAILAAMTAKYVSNYSADFAILVAFISGLVILGMGILQLGFLVEFISMPVISGFTTAAALQIAASQLKSFVGLSGPSGNYFAESIENLIVNFKTMKLYEPILGLATIIMLMLLKKLGEGCKRTDGFIKQVRWFISLSRNAVVIVVGMTVAFILKITLEHEPLILIGDIGGGLPEFSWPPFSTVVGNQTYSFGDMMNVMGTGFMVLPLVAIIESVAIAKAFAGGATVDATQEMIALGLCNIIGSFGQSMPITGSFTRTALNHMSGVVTPLGGVTKVILLIIALTSLTSTFYYIPKASLSGLIISAMFSMIDYKIVQKLWRNSKKELAILIVTGMVCLLYGLEYGIIAGIVIEAALLLHRVSRPKLSANFVKSQKGDLLIVPLTEDISYCAAEHIRRTVIKESQELSDTVIVIDGTNLKNMDFTAASNLVLVVKELDKKSLRVLMLNFNLILKNLCVDIDRSIEEKFVYGTNVLVMPEVFLKAV